MEKLNSNKKIILTVAVFIISILALVLTLKIASNSSQSHSNKPASSQTEYEGYVEYADGSDEKTTDNNEQNTAKVTQPQNVDTEMSDAVSDIIYAYMSGQYYIDAVMEADGTETPLKMAISGKNFQTTADLQGLEISILYKNNNVYFINEKEKKYILLSDVLMQEVDFDLQELSQLTEYLNLTQYNFTDFEKYADKYDSKKCDCYKYSNDEMSVTFFFLGDELKKVDMGNASGAASTSVIVNEFSPEVPSDVMSLSGLTKTNIIGFFGQSLY